MPMKITTLGTSHGDPTRHEDARFSRFNSSTLIEIGEAHYLLDAGEPVTALLIREQVSISSLWAIFVTHAHSDHAGGLPALLCFLDKYGRRGPDQYTSLIASEAGLFEGLAPWLHALHKNFPFDQIESTVAIDGEIYRDDQLVVTAHPTHHIPPEGDTPRSWAYALEHDHKRLVYTGDLSGDFSDFPRVALDEPCDLCLCEATHFPPEKAAPVLEGAPIKRLVFNHVHNPWHGEDGEDAWLEHFEPRDFPVSIARDGDCFSLS